MSGKQIVGWKTAQADTTYTVAGDCHPPGNRRKRTQARLFRQCNLSGLRRRLKRTEPQGEEAAGLKGRNVLKDLGGKAVQRKLCRDHEARVQPVSANLERSRIDGGESRRAGRQKTNCDVRLRPLQSRLACKTSEHY